MQCKLPRKSLTSSTVHTKMYTKVCLVGFHMFCFLPRVIGTLRLSECFLALYCFTLGALLASPHDPKGPKNRSLHPNTCRISLSLSLLSLSLKVSLSLSLKVSLSLSISLPLPQSLSLSLSQSLSLSLSISLGLSLSLSLRL